MKRMKITIIGLLALLSTGIITISWTDGRKNSQKVDEYSLELMDLKNDALDILDDVRYKYADGVISKVSPAIEEFQALYEEVAGASDGVVMSKVADGLNKLSNTFSGLANGMFNTILQDRENSLEDMQLVKVNAEKIQLEIQKEISDLEDEKKEAERELEKTDDETEIKKLNILISSIDSKINSRVNIDDKYVKFIVILENAIENISENNSSLDVLFYTLKINAGVWKDAADAAKVAEVFSEITSEFEDLESFDGLVDGLVDSWSVLDAINNDLHSFDTDTDG